jgi:DNA-binding beta-propeller fold protein YncE
MTSERVNRELHTRGLTRIAGLLALLPGLLFAADLPTGSYSQSLVLDTGLSLPSDVAVGRDGAIYVVNGGNHEIAVFNRNGLRIATLGTQGSEPGELFEPVGIDIGPRGDIYVADKGNQRLQVYAADGSFLRELPLEEEGEEVDPVDVAVSADGTELFVSANNSHRILVFSSGGRLLRGWGSEGEDQGQFRYPATIDLDTRGNVFVVDVLNQRVQKFDADGNFLLSFGGLGGKPGTLFRPKGIAVDASGQSYVSDSFLGAIQVFDANGELVHVLGADGVASAFETPVGMTIDGSRLLVVQMLPGNVRALDTANSARAPAEEQP